MKIAKGTPTWIAVFPVLALLSFLYVYFTWVSNPVWVSVFFILLALFLLLLTAFFRDPERDVRGDVCSAADGVVTKVERVQLPTRDIKGKGEYLFISVFMNVHNVHVNRAPVAGRIKTVRHIPGTFTFAFDKDSDVNERTIMEMDTTNGKIYVIQIAGWFARRIVPYVVPGQKVSKGERIGFIRFGSRVDVYLPAGKYESIVKEGQRVRAASTAIARLK